jgi:hypothetical protein
VHGANVERIIINLVHRGDTSCYAAAERRIENAIDSIALGCAGARRDTTEDRRVGEISLA